MFLLSEILGHLIYINNDVSGSLIEQVATLQATIDSIKLTVDKNNRAVKTVVDKSLK